MIINEKLESLTLVNQVLKYNTDVAINNLVIEDQNSEYEGITFQIDKFTYRSRLAKITPKKKGYFVVFWKKDMDNKNIPFEYSESPDKLIITIIDGQHQGQFIFPKEILRDKGILSYDNKLGKMALRVYPSWVDNLNPNARKTQLWQLPYFMVHQEQQITEFVQSLYF